jgi:hypothetical protein
MFVRQSGSINWLFDDAVKGGDDVVPRARIAAAACLMASGLLMAGTGASLALADPESVGASPAIDDPAATSGVPVPGGLLPGTAPASGESKPTAQVGDGRNGIPTGATTGTASHTPTDPVPTVVTESSSKLGEQESGAAAQTGTAAPSEQPSGTTTRVSVDPTVTAAVVDSSLAQIPPVQKGKEEVQEPTPKNPELGWPWSWWTWFPPQVSPGDGGGGDVQTQASGQPPVPPLMLPTIPTIPREIVPQLPGISFDPLIDAVNGFVTGVNGAVTGLATAASQLPFTQITLPVIVIPGGDPATGAGSGRGAGGAPGPGIVPRPGIPAAPKPPVITHGGSPTPTPTPPQSGQQKQSPPAFSADNQLPAPSYRMGYMEYLRAAGIGQVAAVAVPGFTGILILTGAGGLIGYRQARAGRSVRSGNTARFTS